MKIEVNIEKKHFYFIAGLIVLMFGVFIVNASYEEGVFHYLSDVVDASGEAISSDGNKIKSEVLDVDFNSFQSRVSGACEENQSIRIINGDGTVVCEEDDVGMESVSWDDLIGIPEDIADGDDLGYYGSDCSSACGTYYVRWTRQWKYYECWELREGNLCTPAGLRTVYDGCYCPPEYNGA